MLYKVMVKRRRLDRGHLQQPRDGIVINKTVAQRKGRTEEENTLVARTIIERIGPFAGT